MTRAERRRTARQQRKAAASPPRTSRWTRAMPALVALGVVVLVGAYVMGRGGEGPEARAAVEADPAAALELASRNAAGDVVRYAGSHHVVYHSSDPLPDGRTGAPDARPTLVWFSGTWCEYCEQMEPFAHGVAANLGERVRFVEKSIDHDRAAATRYAVRGTPTFVLIDGSGREISRFFYQPTPGAFSKAIEAALAKAS